VHPKAKTLGITFLVWQRSSLPIFISVGSILRYWGHLQYLLHGWHSAT